MCDINWRTVTVAIRGSVNGPLTPSCLANGSSSSIAPSSTSCMIATAVSIFETLAMRKRVSAVAGLDSNGFSMPNAAVCSTWPLRMHSDPSAQITEVDGGARRSRRRTRRGRTGRRRLVAPRVRRRRAGTVVVGGRRRARGRRRRRGRRLGRGSGRRWWTGGRRSRGRVGDAETDFAAVSPDEFVTATSATTATTATPLTPITQKRRAMTPFSPLRGPDRRHLSPRVQSGAMSVLTAAQINDFLASEFQASTNRCEAVGEGWAIALLTVDATALRPGGIISGPTVFGLCDAALYYACFTVIGLEPMTLTSEMSIRFLRPPEAPRSAPAPNCTMSAVARSSVRSWPGPTTPTSLWPSPRVPTCARGRLRSGTDRADTVGLMAERPTITIPDRRATRRPGHRRRDHRRR